MGKTAIVVGSGLNAAMSTQKSVAIFSMEMSKEQLVQRMLCHEALVDLGDMRRGKLRDDDYVRLSQAAAHLNVAPIWVDNTAPLSVMQLRAKVRRMKLEQPNLGMVIIDYIQLMVADAENRTQEVSVITRGLKGLAMEMDLPILALSQLSRAPEARSGSGHRPVMSDLRESGSIEQDADVVGLLYRPEYYFGDTGKDGEDLRGKAELIIGKQRNGPTGTVPLYFRKECTRFESVPKQQWAGAA
jgi:replicative DNA helicase